MGDVLISGRPNVTRGYVDTGLTKATTHTYTAASEAAMQALSANLGDVAFRTDENRTYILSGDDPSVLANWKPVLSPAGISIATYSASVSTTWAGDSTAGYSQDIEVTGLLATDTPFIDIVFSSTLATAKLEAESYAKVSKATTDDDTLTLICFDFKPTIAFNLQLKCIR